MNEIVLPYTSTEFIDILSTNANLHSEYAQGLADLNATVDMVKEAEQVFESATQDAIAPIKDMNQQLQNATQGLNSTIQALHVEITDLLAGDFIYPRVMNEGSIVPTGTYANATYYDVNFGVRIGYGRNGDIYIVMMGGTTTSYEYLRFVAGTVPNGVTIETAVPTSTSYVTAMPGMLQVGIIHGVGSKVTMSIDMSSYNASYDYTDVTISLTEAAE